MPEPIPLSDTYPLALLSGQTASGQTLCNHWRSKAAIFQYPQVHYKSCASAHTPKLKPDMTNLRQIAV